MNTLPWGEFFVPDYDDRVVIFVSDSEAETFIVRCRTAKQTKELCEFLSQAIAGKIDLKKASKYIER